MPSESNRRAPRTVRPRKPVTNADRPIIVIIDNHYCTETGETGDLTDLLLDLRQLPPSILIAANESAKILKPIQELWGADTHFNFKVSPVEREIFTGRETSHRLVLSLMAVSWFGWHGEKRGRNNTIRNRYHLLIDPLTFSGGWLSERTFTTYMQWGQDIRGFCVEQKWNLRPTQGSVARQALQDRRFYPRPRRKVPLTTNEHVRPRLPGNHYQLTVTAYPEHEYEADYLDQSRCHHYHALNAALPDANYLYGYGNFRHPDDGSPPFRTGRRMASFCDRFIGMLYVTIDWSQAERQKTRFIPHYLAHYTGGPVYVFTEDMPLLDSLGVTITGILAAWGSYHRDTGIAKYAEWALAELEHAAPLWKKTLLLSPYGALATTPRKQTVAYHRSRKGESRTIRSKSGVTLPVSYHETTRMGEPGTNNVLHRALIEASNRTETLLYARYLESQGYNVLSVYVDALIVEHDDGLPPPLLAPPWRHDRRLTRLRFLSETQFTSDQLRKLPGVTGQQARDALSFGQLKGARRLGSRDEQRIRAFEAWQAGKKILKPPLTAADDKRRIVST